MSENKEKLENTYDIAVRKFHNPKNKTTQYDEDELSQAYQALVRAGLRMQIKRKYR